MEDRIILVDEMDNEIGSEEKLAAHRTPMLHRAFSIFLYDDSEEEIKVLLQQRALHKYHSGGLWANSCCSHPRVGESLKEAGQRRLVEELGVKDCLLRELDSFIYFYRFADDMYELELDHVMVGRYSGEVDPNPDEIAQVKWVTLTELEEILSRNDEKEIAPWLPMASSYFIKGVSPFREAAY